MLAKQKYEFVKFTDFFRNKIVENQWLFTNEVIPIIRKKFNQIDVKGNNYMCCILSHCIIVNWLLFQPDKKAQERRRNRKSYSQQSRSPK